MLGDGQPPSMTSRIQYPGLLHRDGHGKTRRREHQILDPHATNARGGKLSMYTVPSVE